MADVKNVITGGIGASPGTIAFYVLDGLGVSVAAFVAQQILGSVYINISPTSDVLANTSPTKSVKSNPTPAENVEIA
ncbi:MAG: hypothetical protein GY774_39965 [Planctomycetes bacterium]|nr:hypothetical protein [Planctomycetota bacterium]